MTWSPSSSHVCAGFQVSSLVQFVVNVLLKVECSSSCALGILPQAIKPEDGSNAPIVKVFKGVGALGTSGAVIAPPPKDDDDDDSMKRLKHKESKEGRDERRRAFYSTLPGAELWADDFMPEAEKKLRKVGVL